MAGYRQQNWMSFRQKEEITCFYTNARSIHNKFDNLLSRLDDEDLIGITETWINENTTDFPSIQIKGYELFVCHRHPDESAGGGVLFYVKNRYAPSVKMLQTKNDVESLWLRMKIRGFKLTVGIIYKPPNQDTETDRLMRNQITRFRKEAEEGNEHFILMGDFNYIIDWKLYSKCFNGKNKDMEDLGLGHSPKDLFTECLFKNELKQNVMKDTRGDNILDLVICDRSTSVKDLKVCGLLKRDDGKHKSDHKIIKFSICEQEDSSSDEDQDQDLF